MQSDIDYTDVTAINIQLNELRSKFDKAMHEGQHDFPDLKETYLQMKELECYINALSWDPDKPMNFHHQMTVTHSWM